MIDSQDLSILHDITYRNVRKVDNLKRRFSMSNRQITYSLKKINVLLADNTQSEIKIKGGDLVLDSKSELFLQQYLIKLDIFNDIYYSKEQRQDTIFIILVCSVEYISLNHLIFMLGISRSTILDDMKSINFMLKQYNIKISYNRVSGYHVVGEESVIRYIVLKKIIDYLYKDSGELFIENLIKRYFQFDYDVIKHLIEESSVFDIKFFENKLKEFIFCFSLLQNRFKVSSPESNNFGSFMDMTSKEYRFSKYLLSGLDLNDNDNIGYIVAWILGISLGDMDKETPDREMMLNVIEQLIYRLENLSGISFFDRQSLIKRLYEHFRPAYYRIFYKFPIINPLTKKIEEEYTELFYLVKESIRPLESLLEREIPKEEIAYLTMHFAASTDAKQIHSMQRYKGLVLCPNGVGTFMILTKELQILFPQIYFMEQDSKKSMDFTNYDIIFMTTIIPEIIPKILSLDIPFIVINPIMTEKEKSQLISRVYQLLKKVTSHSKLTQVMEIVKHYVNPEIYQKIKEEAQLLLMEPESKSLPEGGEHGGVDLENHMTKGGRYPLLSELTNDKLIKLKVEATNWEEAIRNSTDVLVENDMVLPSYIDDMVQITREIGPYIVITKHVAIPHARPEAGAKKVAISISTLSKPIAFGSELNDPVKYIFGLSALDNKTHLVAMTELVELLDQESFYECLDKATSSKEVMDYIYKFESRELK